jgi:hypothetical protein
MQLSFISRCLFPCIGHPWCCKESSFVHSKKKGIGEVRVGCVSPNQRRWLAPSLQTITPARLKFGGCRFAPHLESSPPTHSSKAAPPGSPRPPSMPCRHVRKPLVVNGVDWSGAECKKFTRPTKCRITIARCSRFVAQIPDRLVCTLLGNIKAA